jgi:single-strand DNA-binding protein
MINKVILVGNLGQDPELRYTQNGKPVANFNLATSEKYRNKSGELVENTEWHKIVCFDKLAENVNEHLEKGKRIFLEGKIQTRSWEDQDGNKKYSTEIIARDIKFI